MLAVICENRSVCPVIMNLFAGLQRDALGCELSERVLRSAELEGERSAAPK